jgi:phenylpyruvate tautomerase PptA (4-oxalocrotonate tautomerase family)
MRDKQFLFTFGREEKERKKKSIGISDLNWALLGHDHSSISIVVAWFRKEAWSSVGTMTFRTYGVSGLPTPRQQHRP